MAIMEWGPALSVNVKQFDDQHKKLVVMVNQLHDAMKVGKGSEVLGPILNSLISYTASHFADEERLMQQHGYLDLAKHKAEHDKLTKQVLDLQKQYQTTKSALSMAVMTFLKDWLANHIQGEDKKYGPFLNGKGIA